MEDYDKKEKFCIVPFILLNTRPNGTIKPCSEVQNMDSIHKDKTYQEMLTNDKKTYWNLQHDDLKEIWNSRFYKDFRLKKINNEYISHCETCYYQDKIGIPSKRKQYIERFYEKYKHIVEYAKNNNGELNTFPIWWEFRLSSLCNLGCRFCIPQTSSFLREEFNKNFDYLTDFSKRDAVSSMKLYQNHGYLSQSEFFINQIFKYLENIEYIELHGGEPTLEPKVWEILEKIDHLGYSSRIHINMFSNCMQIKEEQIKLLNKFKSGKLGLSIDAYREENHYIRYPSKWDKIENNLLKFNKLDKKWDKRIASVIVAYNTLSVHKLLDWYNNFAKEHDLDIWMNLNVIKHPFHFKPQIIPLEYRLKEVEKVEKFLNSWMCTESKFSEIHKKEIGNIIKSLKSEEKIDEKWIENFVKYTLSLDKIRKQNVLDYFPHLDFLFTKK
ncbi:MAG: twitch domain-containing radical SAM protein [Candidatus Dojkabacteria bacterium]|nr:twitch domain-containing radical SAM protein [Candidatus Dojkabacteria bacterium]